MSTAHVRMVALLGCAIVLGTACAAEPRKPLEMVPIGTVVPYVPKTSEADQAETTPGGGDPQRKDECLGALFDNLDKAFARNDCNASPDADVEMKGKLSIKVVPDGSSVAPGGNLLLRMTITNESQEKTPVFFRLDPTAHFEVHATDAKGRRVDVPAGKKPHAKEPESRTARVTLMPGGVIKVSTTWSAVKRKWASHNGKLSAVPAGALPRGKYKLRIVPPLVGVRDMAEFQPEADIAVGN
ncbi:MAG: hypothetical protein U0174_05380 [Polyangiaceae bacterium]